jgi:hypothetical protein
VRADFVRRGFVWLEMRAKISAMKRIVAICAALLLLLGVQPSFGQVFWNFNFESAYIPSGTQSSSFLPISYALPGWSGSVGTNPATQVLYNDLTGGTAEICLLGLNGDYFSNSVIAGQYTVVLQTGEATTSTAVSASIAQTGLVPIGSLSLQFWAVTDPADLAVTFDGQNIPIVPLTPGPSYYELQEYGGDISQYAGQVGQLQFSAEPNDFPFANVYLDSIIFSTSPVPEPGTCGLILCGAVLFGLKRGRKSLP